MHHQLMIQVSKPNEVKDPSAKYEQCTSGTIEECRQAAARVSRARYDELFVRWFIETPCGQEIEHGNTDIGTER